MEAEQSGVERSSFWDEYRAVECSDGKKRRIPVEPEFQPLANGVPAGVVRLRGYGNAIVPQVAAVFIRAFMDTMEEIRENERKHCV